MNYSNSKTEGGRGGALNSPRVYKKVKILKKKLYVLVGLDSSTYICSEWRIHEDLKNYNWISKYRESPV